MSSGIANAEREFSQNKIDIFIEIKRVSDGVVQSGIWKDWDWNSYWWEEGNASCDCNRRSFFEAFENPICEDGEDDDAGDDGSWCGDGGFIVRISNNTTKEVLYDEFD